MPFFGPLGDRGNQKITILEHRIGEKQEKIGPEAMPETNSIFHCFWDAERRSGQVKAERLIFGIFGCFVSRRSVEECRCGNRWKKK